MRKYLIIFALCLSFTTKHLSLASANGTTALIQTLALKQILVRDAILLRMGCVARTNFHAVCPKE